MKAINGTFVAASLLVALAACASPYAEEPTATDAEALRVANEHVVTRFDATKGELPEGLAVRDGNAYVSFAPLASIARIDERGVVSHYADVPSTSGGTKGYTLGLAFGGDGSLFVAQASFDPASVTPGIYRVPSGGGTVTTPWATHPAMTFPNGLVLDTRGRLFVADSGGAVFRVDGDGTTTEWKRDPLLAYDPNACSNAPPVPIGANGIAVTSSDVWVTNTSTGGVVRIPIARDGSAGAAALELADCKLAGADGIAREQDGSLVVAVNVRNALVRIRTHGPIATATLDEGAPLDAPASVVADGRALFVTNAAFFSAASGNNPQPSVVRYRGR